MNPSARWVVERIHKRHDRARFSCGRAALDTFLKDFARQNDDKGICRTYVVVREGTPTVLGYFTLSSLSVDFEHLPEGLRRGLPAYPIPCILLGKLAVDRQAQGIGLGRFLLWEALKISHNVSREIAVFAVVVDSLDESAREFYIHNGFTSLEDNPRRLLLAMRTLQLALQTP